MNTYTSCRTILIIGIYFNDGLQSMEWRCDVLLLSVDEWFMSCSFRYAPNQPTQNHTLVDSRIVQLPDRVATQFFFLCIDEVARYHLPANRPRSGLSDNQKGRGWWRIEISRRQAKGGLLLLSLSLSLLMVTMMIVMMSFPLLMLQLLWFRPFSIYNHIYTHTCIYVCCTHYFGVSIVSW